MCVGNHASQDSHSCAILTQRTCACAECGECGACSSGAAYREGGEEREWERREEGREWEGGSEGVGRGEGEESNKLE